MRHLFVTNDFPPKTGGIESYLVALCSGFPSGDVVVIAPAREGHEEIDAALPYEVVRIGGRYIRAGGGSRQAVVEAVKRYEVDAVHFLNALPLGRIARHVRAATDKPVTVFAHGSEVLARARFPLLRRSLRRVLTSADLVFAVSRFTQDAVARITRDKARTAVLHPAVDVERFSLAVSGARVREAHRLGSRFTVLFVSRLVKRKGAEILIRSLPRIPKAHVLVVGSGPEAANLRRVAEDVDVADRVQFVGRVPDEMLPEYYAAADVFCMPCTDRYGGLDTEGFGIVYIEAAASGIPSVAGSCGGSVEAVVDGETGIVLPDPTPATVAEALARLGRSGSLRARMGAAGRERAEREFAPEVLAGRLERELARALRARAR